MSSTEQTTPDQMMALITTSADSMVSWSDAKKSEFSELFKQRTNASAYICIMTAEYIAKAAKSRYMINQSKTIEFGPHGFKHSLCQPSHNRYSDPSSCGGRSCAELDEVAKKASIAALKRVPSVQTALSIVAPEIVAEIERRDEIFAKMERQAEILSTIPSELSLSDAAFQDMTVRDFRKECIKLLQKRDTCVKTIDSLHIQFVGIDKEISKALFKGIPGISEAVLNLITYYIERAKSLVQLSRRAEEKVKFGDSEAAASMLQKFEQDEQTVNASVKAEFDAAMENLKAIARKNKLPKEMKAFTAKLLEAQND
jgi:hypothetical protein